MHAAAKAGWCKIRSTILLIGATARRNPGPQGFSARQTLCPPMLPLGPPGPSNWRSRLHGSAKWLIGAPCLTHWSPHATQSLPSSDPNEPKGSKMEPKVIAHPSQEVPIESNMELQASNPQ